MTYPQNISPHSLSLTCPPAIAGRQSGDGECGVTPCPKGIPSLLGKVKCATNKREKTFGEVAFERITYTGVGFFVNEALSLYLTDKFVYGSWKKYCDQFSSMLAKVTHDKPDNVRGMALTFMLMMGGNLLMPPIKLLKDNESYWVRKLNHLRDWWKNERMTTEQVEARDQEVEQALAAEPKQSWGTLLSARALAVGTNMAISRFVIGGERTQQIEEYTGEKVTGFMRNSGSPWLRKLSENPRVQGVNRLLGLETFYCITSSTVLEVMSKFFANWKSGKDIKDPAPEGVAPIAASQACVKPDESKAGAQEKTLATVPLKRFSSAVRTRANTAGNALSMRPAESMLERINNKSADKPEHQLSS